MGPSWCQVGAKLGQVGAKFGEVGFWANLGANLEPTWGQVGAKLGPSWVHNRILTGMLFRSSFWIQFCSLLSSISDTFSGTKWCTKVNLKQKVSNLQNLILAEAGAQFLMFRGVEKHRKIDVKTIALMPTWNRFWRGFGRQVEAQRTPRSFQKRLKHQLKF